MKTTTLLITFLFSLSVYALAQVDSNRVIEKTKGTWPYPLRSGILLGPSTHGYQEKKATFIGSNNDSVFAICSGKVIAIQQIESVYLIITKYKDYFITYDGLKIPKLNIGDLIVKGKYIGNLAENLDGEFSLDVHLNKKSDELDTHLWFK